MDRTASPFPTQARRLPFGRLPRAAIRRYAWQVVERFHPDKVILFGSHAYGRPHEGSDVDLLVIMPVRSMSEAAARMRWHVPAPFAMGLLVRTPEFLAKRLVLGDWFVREILDRGVVLYDAADARVDAQGRR
jgi:predicted nucleotidyltransferase